MGAAQAGIVRRCDEQRKRRREGKPTAMTGWRRTRSGRGIQKVKVKASWKEKPEVSHQLSLTEAKAYHGASSLSFHTIDKV
jgi:hypothetical protein